MNVCTFRLQGLTQVKKGFKILLTIGCGLLFFSRRKTLQSITLFQTTIMTTQTNLSASLEDYIEAIYHIVDEKLVARSKDIAARLDVSRASVTEALRALSKKELIHYAPYEAITMTEKGKQVAQDVIFRHDTLKRFFTDVLAIDDETAENGACKIEHAAPPEIISRMVNFIEFIRLCPRGGDDLIEGFSDFHQQGRTNINCNDCVSSCQEKIAASNRL